MKLSKYHGLGNDYLVADPADVDFALDAGTVHRICRRHYGVGSDGLLVGPFPSASSEFRLQIFNTDGSEAEKSGNGLRIFARFLWDRGLVSDAPFTVETAGGEVTCRLDDDGRRVTVEMGEVSFWSERIPMVGEPREVLDEELVVDGEALRVCAATLGNPHCVVLTDGPTPELARRLGPLLENDDRFPRRTNVQFMEALDSENIRIEIWERGSGYTLASGSSSTASAAVAHRLGLCGPEITVHMPGGRLEISFRDGFFATLAGPVAKVFDATLDPSVLDEHDPAIQRVKDDGS